MWNKITIDYTAQPRQNTCIQSHRANDPVEAEDFLMGLLAGGSRIKEIRRDGLVLTDTQFNIMLKVAAERIASLMLSESLALEASEIKHRFGFAVMRNDQSC
jgi:hypothetical protein